MRQELGGSVTPSKEIDPPVQCRPSGRWFYVWFREICFVVHGGNSFRISKPKTYLTILVLQLSDHVITAFQMTCHIKIMLILQVEYSTSNVVRIYFNFIIVNLTNTYSQLAQ